MASERPNHTPHLKFWRARPNVLMAPVNNRRIWTIRDNGLTRKRRFNPAGAARG